jgi:hypothetical protein
LAMARPEKPVRLVISRLIDHHAHAHAHAALIPFLLLDLLRHRILHPHHSR